MIENKEKTCGCQTTSIEIDKIINIDELKDNSIIIFRVTEMNKGLQLALFNLVQKYGEKLDLKNCSLLVLGAEANLETLSEEEMGKAGWEKKEKSRIIIPK